MKDPNFRSITERGVSLARRYFLCQESEETADHSFSIVQRQGCFGSYSSLLLGYLG